jgi:hypothetical protein
MVKKLIHVRAERDLAPSELGAAMAMIRPDVIVSLELYSEGGRQEATPLDHLGCIFEYEGENFECRLLLEDVGPLLPGAQAKVPIKFLRPDLIKERLRVGSHFRLRESKNIGEGVIDSIPR